MRVDRPGGAQGPQEIPEAAESGRAEEATGAFAEELRKGAAVPEGMEGLPALVEKLRTGELTIEGVVESMVDQVVSRTPLSPAGQEALRATLQSLLAEDPTLRRLTRTIEQG